MVSKGRGRGRPGDREAGQAGHFISFAIRQNGTLGAGSWAAALAWRPNGNNSMPPKFRGRGLDAGNRSLAFAPSFWNHAL